MDSNVPQKKIYVSSNHQKEMKLKLMKDPNIINFIDKMNTNPENHECREKLPLTRQEFEVELQKLQNSDKKRNNFDEVLSKVRDVFIKESNNMLKNGKANQENWYDAITCNDHLWGNYKILKQYAHQLAQVVGKRLQDEEDFSLKKIRSNLNFLHMIRQVCDTTFILMKEKKEKPNGQDSHKKFLELIDLCSKTILVIMEQKEVKDQKE